MKIRHVVRGRCNPDNADGIIRHTYHLAHAQLRLGNDVAVYGLESRSEEPELIDRQGLRVYAFPRTGSPFAVHPAVTRQLAADDWDVEMVHIQAPQDPAMYGLSLKLVGRNIPYFLSPHAMWEPQSLARHRYRKAVYKRLFDDRMTAAAAGIHATSTAEVAGIRSYAPESRVFVIRNSIDLAGIDSVASDDDYWWDRFGVERHERVFVFLGRLDPYQKGLDLLLEAWAVAVEACAGIRLGLIGPPWREDLAVTNLVSSLGIEDTVLRAGSLFGAEKYRALRAADCYIQTSRYEGSPYSIQEGFACGLPAILTPGTNFADIAESYHAGWSVPLQSDAISERIKYVASLPKPSLVEMGRAGRELVETRHSLPQASQRMVDAYQASLNGADFSDDD